MSKKAKQTNVDEPDPSVPSDLLELYVELEEANTTPEEFKEVYGNAAS